MEDIKTRIERICADNGLSLVEACDRAGVAKSTIYRWLDKEPQSLRTYRRLMEAFERHAEKPANEDETNTENNDTTT